MAGKVMSIAQAKASLSEAVREVETGDPIVITRHGKPVAALVAVRDLETLERLRAAGPEQGLAAVAGGWDGSSDLAVAIAARPRGGRRAPSAEGPGSS